VRQRIRVPGPCGVRQQSQSHNPYILVAGLVLPTGNALIVQPWAEHLLGPSARNVAVVSDRRGDKGES
jgi:hypothetical protein